MRPSALFLSLSLLALPTTLACGDKDGDDSGAPTDGGGTDGGADGGGTGGDGGTSGDGGTGGDGGGTTFDCATEAWADQTGDAKGEYMYNCVVPVMKPIFQAHDPERFADFGCATCHGEDFGGGTYQMPALWALDWGDMGSWPEGYNDFMTTQVVPEMATLLGGAPYDPTSNPEGFGCNGCHR